MSTNTPIAKMPVLQMTTAFLPVEEYPNATPESAPYWRETRQCTMFGMHSPVDISQLLSSSKEAGLWNIAAVKGPTDFFTLTHHDHLASSSSSSSASSASASASPPAYHRRHDHHHRKDRPSSSFTDTVVPTYTWRFCQPSVNIISS